MTVGHAKAHDGRWVGLRIVVVDEVAVVFDRRTSSFPHELGGQPEPQLKCGYFYEYDEHGNWMSRNETSEVGGNTTTRTQVRHLTYHL